MPRVQIWLTGENHVTSSFVPRSPKIRRELFDEALLLEINCFTPTAEGLPIAYAITLHNDLEIDSRANRAAGCSPLLPRPATNLCRRCVDRIIRDLGCDWPQGRLAGCPRSYYQARRRGQGRYSIPASARSDCWPGRVRVQGEEPRHLEESRELS